jgi:predicted Zn finger-like uncharacterized protein
MLIVCPSCTTAYRIELSTLGAAGRSVRCARCRTVWLASVADMAPAALALSPVPAPVPVPNGANAADQPAQPPAEEPAETAGPARAADGIDESSGGSPDAPAAGAAALIVANSPPLVPSEEQDKRPALDSTPAAGPDIETVAARRERNGKGPAKRRGRARSLPGLPTIILLLAGVLAALVHWRANVVRLLPQTASLFSAVGLPVNLRGLSFDNVKTSVEAHEGVMVLVVEGVVANLTRQSLDVPRLRFAVRNAAGYEVYAWTSLPAQAVLGPGDIEPFRSRLASPPADGQDVIVRFFNRRDVAAGAH